MAAKQSFRLNSDSDSWYSIKFIPFKSRFKSLISNRHFVIGCTSQKHVNKQFWCLHKGRTGRISSNLPNFGFAVGNSTMYHYCCNVRAPLAIVCHSTVAQSTIPHYFAIALSLMYASPIGNFCTSTAWWTFHCFPSIGNTAVYTLSRTWTITAICDSHGERSLSIASSQSWGRTVQLLVEAEDIRIEGIPGHELLSKLSRWPDKITKTT